MIKQKQTLNFGFLKAQTILEVALAGAKIRKFLEVLEFQFFDCYLFYCVHNERLGKWNISSLKKPQSVVH